MKECPTHHNACDCREAMHKETEKKLAVAADALAKVCTQNRLRGYPTGQEWGTLVTVIDDALERIK